MSDPARGIVPPTVPERLAEKQYRHPDLSIRPVYEAVADLPSRAGAQATDELAALGFEPSGARLDRRGGRWATLVGAMPLLPGEGRGNELTWEEIGGPAPADPAALEQRAWEAFTALLASHRTTLGIDPAEVTSRIAVHDQGRLIQIHAPRTVDGVPVRGAYVSAVVNHGNLVLFGASNWGEVEIPTRPALSSAEARRLGELYLAPVIAAGEWGRPELFLVPTARGPGATEIVTGRGYAHRLVWAIRPLFAGEHGRWELLVDAHSGEVISFEDTNRYATARRVAGGVLPLSNDGIGPEGTEQPGWPMPFAYVESGGDTLATDAGGGLGQCVDGTVSSSLSGPYVTMSDVCGPISLASTGDLDFGTSGGTDCATPGPGFGGLGNTHASRTAFHEVNRIAEMARAQLPGNPWLQQQLTVNVNIDLTCNAFWGGGSLNFYREGGGCANTGELAGVFDHEWGHGLDDNDANPTIASPSGEGIADIYAALRTGRSCIGRGFNQGANCTGYGDPCTACDGVRDIDYLKRVSMQPHDYSWSNANCGGRVHCVGYVYSEAVWSLWKRELQQSPYNYDDNTAHEIVTRLTFLGAGLTGTWFSGGPPNGGCAASSGYMNYLAADDDNGDLYDGTPHMTAIFNAFDDQEIACGTPTVQDSGCAGTPTGAPAVTATPFDRGVDLSWGAVAGASSYQVFRTDGVLGCDLGKTKVGETTGTELVDGGLTNGREYSYIVIPMGADASCFGPASTCTAVTPAAGAGLPAVSSSAALAVSAGDGDGYIDNCELATASLDVHNVGSVALTNVRIDAVRAISHPGTLVGGYLQVTPSSLPPCGGGTVAFDFIGQGLAFGDTLVFEVDVTSDELAPVVETTTVSLPFTESSSQFEASKTWDFESDLDGWTVIEGTFNQTTSGGGAGGSTGYAASSAFQNNQCDQVRSPAFQLTATSTMTLENNYQIEGFAGQWWDRANIAVLEAGARHAVEPDGGRLYNATGSGATCATVGQSGWADVNNSWGSSNWSAGALGSAGRAGQTVQLDVAYGTDPAVSFKGFWFDQVTVTDAMHLVEDAQSDTCACLSLGLEVGGSHNGPETISHCRKIIGLPDLSIEGGADLGFYAPLVVFLEGATILEGAVVSFSNGMPPGP